MAFNPLADFKIQVEAPKHVPKVVTGDAVEEGRLLLAEKTSLQLAKEEIELASIRSTIEQLSAFGATVSRYGLTRSLLAFADHNKVLSTAIPAIPSIETLTSDRSAKNSKDVVAAVEASVASMKEVYQHKLAAHVNTKKKVTTSESLVSRLHLAGCVSTRVAVLASQHPEKMEPLVIRIEKLAEIAEANDAFHEDFDSICVTWYLSDDKDDNAAMSILKTSIVRLEKLAKALPHKA